MEDVRETVDETVEVCVMVDVAEYVSCAERVTLGDTVRESEPLTVFVTVPRDVGDTDPEIEGVVVDVTEEFVVTVARTEWEAEGDPVPVADEDAIAVEEKDFTGVRDVDVVVLTQAEMVEDPDCEFSVDHVGDADTLPVTEEEMLVEPERLGDTVGEVLTEFDDDEVVVAVPVKDDLNDTDVDGDAVGETTAETETILDSDSTGVTDTVEVKDVRVDTVPRAVSENIADGDEAAEDVN